MGAQFSRRSLRHRSAARSGIDRRALWPVRDPLQSHRARRRAALRDGRSPSLRRPAAPDHPAVDAPADGGLRARGRPAGGHQRRRRQALSLRRVHDAAMITALWLLAAQGVLGAFDTVWYHEWRARLPRSGRGAARELGLHAARDFLYAIIFATLPRIEW